MQGHPAQSTPTEEGNASVEDGKRGVELPWKQPQPATPAPQLAFQLVPREVSGNGALPSG